MVARHVLVVDDARVDRLVASRVLEYCNIQVTAVEGPMEALRFLAKDHDVQLILTDYNMPDMSGYDLLLEIKNSPQLSHIPVVITCTDYDHERVQMCYDGGAEDFITKPIEVVDVPRLLSYM